MTDLPLYEFGDIQLDLRRMTLSRAGAVVTIEPKAFDVLRYLVEHRDRLVTKDELLDAIWKDTFVTPNVLTRAVTQLRNAIGDDAEHPRFVETVPKRGYRFIAEARRVSPSENQAEAGPPREREDAQSTDKPPCLGGRPVSAWSWWHWWSSRLPWPSGSDVR